MKKNSVTDALIWIIGTELVGVLSALLSGGFSDFYDVYRQPPLLPPAWLFPVVWTILYAAMGFSAYLISRNNCPEAIKAYFVQLAFNFAWSIVFFRFELLWGAFAVIIALLVAVIVMIVRFFRCMPIAAYINIPYLVWVTFAAYLNLATAILN